MKKSLLIVLQCLFAVSLFAQYQIGQTSISFTDASRSNRSIPTEIYYPAASAGTDVPVQPGEWPIVVFGHGFSMNADNFTNVADYLAPKGYIVMLTNTETGLFGTSHPDFARDFVFSVLEMQGSNVPALFDGHVSDRSAVMGHSMGGGASMLAIQEPDAPFTTAVSFGAVETTPPSMNAGVIDVTNDIPVLVVAGELDCVAEGSMSAGGPQTLYPALNSSFKAFAEITDGTHCNFGTGFSSCALGEFGCPGGLSEADQHAAMFNVACPWIDYFLKDICSAMDDFDSHLASSAEITSSMTDGTAPAIPAQTLSLITESMGVLSIPAGYTNVQWSEGGTPISGATGNSYTPTVSGTYALTALDANGCDIIASGFMVTVVGIQQIEGVDQLIVSPNPAKDVLFIDIETGIASEMTATIFSAEGKAFQATTFSVQGNTTETLSVEGLVPGMYFLRISNPEGVIVRKFVKK